MMNEFEVAAMIAEETGISPWWPAAEASSRWVRVGLNAKTVADSRRTQLLVQYGPPPMLPTYFFPIEDIDSSALVNKQTRDDGSHQWDVEIDGVRVVGGAWTHPRTDGPLASLRDLVTFTWMGALDWFEEDDPVFAHARDPHKRVDVAPSSRHVQVVVRDQLVAESANPTLLFETTLPPRYYLPQSDVRMDLLVTSDTVTQCPYKGTARYWSLAIGDEQLADIAWSYPTPVPENPRIKDLVCFFNERVELIVDGQHLERPLTPWS